MAAECTCLGQDLDWRQATLHLPQACEVPAKGSDNSALAVYQELRSNPVMQAVPCRMCQDLPVPGLGIDPWQTRLMVFTDIVPVAHG